MLELFNVMIESSNVSKNKRTAKCDKSLVSCNIDTANITLKKFVYNSRLVSNLHPTP